jgi:UDPglucose 6-dehydrogenase
VAYDPTVTGDPPEIGGAAACVTSVAAALHDADAAVVMTPWPEFREIAPEAWQTMRHRRLIDAQRFLEATAAPLLDEYVAFGRGLSHA